jgi:hypothetical protein
MVGGRVVWGAGDFAALDDNPLPPAMPDWSPVRTYGGYGAWAAARTSTGLSAHARMSCGCASSCGVYGHDHGKAWGAMLPVADLKGFLGALGCACWNGSSSPPGPNTCASTGALPRRTRISSASFCASTPATARRR